MPNLKMLVVHFHLAVFTDWREAWRNDRIAADKRIHLTRRGFALACG
jgi:hypothetical protein